jgi:Zn-dependent protease
MLGTSSLPLTRLFGIRIGVNVSWFLVLFLFIFWMQDSFTEMLGDQTTGYLTAVGAALAFFGSIVLHELGHALAARREGIEVTGIDLFFFGGVMKMSRDTDSPGAEFRVAVAGPLVTLVIVVLGGLLGIAMNGGLSGFLDTAVLDGAAGVATLLVSFLVTMNAILLVFNLIPAFPLDGGRIARAVAWKITGDRTRATRFSARIGQGFAMLLIGYGLYRLLVGDVTSGLWLAVLGWLLGGAARSAVVQSAFTERIEGITVADIMDAEPVTIPGDTDAVRAYEDYFLRYQGWEWFAVVDEEGRYAGLAHRRAVEHAALEEGGAMAVRDVAAPGAAEAQVRADAPLEALLSSEPLRRLGALMAVDAEGRLRGVVTFEQVTRALRARFAAPA